MTYKRDNELGALLERTAAGESDAFEEIYERTSPRFLAIITRMVGDADLAMDIVQEAYISIWRHAARFDENKGRAFTWMLVIMRNKALDALRSADRKEETRELTPEIIDPGETPEVLASRSAIWSVVQTKLRDLPDGMGRAITLRICYGLEYREIAVVLSSTPNTVKSWVRRGLIRLRTRMPADSLASVI